MHLRYNLLFSIKGSYGAGISLASEGEEFDRLYSIQQKCKTTINTLPGKDNDNTDYQNIKYVIAD